MREEAPVNKNPNAKNRGALRASLRAGPLETDGEHWRAVYTAAEHIRYVLNATRPHRIEAKAGGVLVFQANGQPGLSGSLAAISYSGLGLAAGRLGRRGGASIAKVQAGYSPLKGGLTFARAVQHPGTKANDFVTRAVTRTLVAGVPGFTQRVQQAIADDIIQLIQEAV